MQEIAVEGARKALGDLVTRVANGGEHVVITKNGIQAARLVGLGGGGHVRIPAALLLDKPAFDEWFAERITDPIRERYQAEPVDRLTIEIELTDGR